MRPDCKQCNKQLAKYTYMFNQWEDLTDAQIEEKARERYGADYQGITRIRRWAWGARPYVSVNVWLGDYGYAGNNHFCSKECGFRWAVSKARREAVAQALDSSLGTVVASARQVREGEV